MGFRKRDTAMSQHIPSILAPDPEHTTHMRIVFDPEFDHGSWPGPLRGGKASAGEDWVGPSAFLEMLETALGIGGPSFTMQERAARLVPAVSRMEGFWARSAEVDPFATARRLLQWRDTLVMGGWAGTAR